MSGLFVTDAVTVMKLPWLSSRRTCGGIVAIKCLLNSLSIFGRKVKTGLSALSASGAGSVREQLALKFATSREQTGPSGVEGGKRISITDGSGKILLICR